MRMLGNDLRNNTSRLLHSVGNLLGFLDWRDSPPVKVNISGDNAAMRDPSLLKVYKYDFLVGEDDLSIRTLVQTLLKSLLPQARIRAEQDGAAVLNQALHDPPDLLIVDLKMPKIDGYCVLRFLKERKCTFPIIVCTVEDVKAADVARDARISEKNLWVVNKPFEIGVFNSCVVEALTATGTPVPVSHAGCSLFRGPVDG